MGNAHITETQIGTTIYNSTPPTLARILVTWRPGVCTRRRYRTNSKFTTSRTAVL